jgi:uncharacterized protein YcgL (UPF0745 family)
MKICSIYKSPKRDEMYLYVEKLKGIRDLPDALIEVFGKPIHVMDMPLKADSTLSRAEAPKVLEDIEEKGYYLQMPPPKEDYLLDLYDPNQAD